MASKSIRLINFIIDTFFVGIIIQIALSNPFLNESEENKLKSNILFFIYLSLYYLFFEYIFGKTLGKLITKTKVVDFNNNKPNFLKILFRTVSRIIPFDALTFFGTKNIGLHDILSKTKVIKD